MNARVCERVGRPGVVASEAELKVAVWGLVYAIVGRKRGPFLCGVDEKRRDERTEE